MKDSLKPGDVLHPITGFIISQNGHFRFGLQGDGNAVIYCGGVAIWATGTEGKGGNALHYQYDGNVVLYSVNGAVLFTTNTQDVGANGQLLMQNDGNLVLYNGNGQAVWASNTVTVNTGVEGPLKNFVFDLDNVQIAPPQSIDDFSQVVCNASDVEQEQEIEVSFTYTESQSFSASFGITVGASVEAEVGIPLVANGKVTASVELSTQVTWGKEHSTSITRAATTKVKVPARSKQSVLTIVTQTPFSVPFTCTAIYVFKTQQGTEFRTALPYQGTYMGKNGFSVNTTFGNPTALADGENCSS